MFALMFVMMPARAAPSGKSGALHARVSIVWTDPPAAWWGPMTGDIEGMAIYPPDPERPNWVSSYHENHLVVHFHELFTICIGEVAKPDGCQNPESYITGHEEGVYVLNPPFQKWHFQAHGWVTGASADYAYMIGWKYIENGWVGGPYSSNPGVGVASALIAPAK